MQVARPKPKWCTTVVNRTENVYYFNCAGQCTAYAISRISLLIYILAHTRNKFCEHRGLNVAIVPECVCHGVCVRTRICTICAERI